MTRQLLVHRLARRGRWAHRLCRLPLSAAAISAALLGLGGESHAQALAPTDAYMSSFHAPRIGDVGVPEDEANTLTLLTNGVVDHTGGVDRIDTWNADETGVTKDFVGLSYAATYRFDTITIELGSQFGDGGDWEAMPKVYILKNTTLTGATVEPDKSPNWVEVTGVVETSGHVFSPTVTPGAGGTIVLDLSGAAAADRTGWGWAVGGVDGNQNGAGVFNFLSLTEASATGVAAAATPFSPPATPVPVNVVSNQFGSVGVANDPFGVVGWRGQAFSSVTNGLVDRDIAGGLGNDGFDTWQNDAAGTMTDFVGLQYGAAYRFDSLKVELGNQFIDGGDWETTPKIFILKNPVDTGFTRPEEDPTNWVEITGATETTGHVFATEVVPGPGGTINFDLSAIPAGLRSGYGWAIGGVDGNQRLSDNAWNFLSISELSATGALVPEPASLGMLAVAGGLLGLARRRR